jgi:Nuclease A inhibitor-like protein
MNNQDLLLKEHLQEAISGLLFMSESEYPFEVFFHETDQVLSVQNLLNFIKFPLNTEVKTLSIDDFFAPVLIEYEWHDLDERETVGKFKLLVTLLKSNLQNPQVYKIGSREIDVYILGLTNSGQWIGVTTKVVET